MKHWTLTMATGLAASAAIATPILAQRGGGDRPSRTCMQEIRALCGQNGQRDRSKIRACVQQRSDQLSAGCREELGTRMQQRRQQGHGDNQQARMAPAKVDQTIFYGAHQRQQIDIYKPANLVDDVPLILHIHGGGWSMGNHKLVQSKPQHFTKSGYIFASTGYRLLPEAPVEEQAKDIGLAIQALAGQANRIGFDPASIIVMGHSAGAHLAALVATDPSYAGEAFSAIRGVVLLDGAGYDVAANMRTAGSRGLQTYQTVFGDDPPRQEAMSPITHVGGRDAPHWLALYVDTRLQSKTQSEALIAALNNKAVQGFAVPVSNTDHGRLNREIGTPAGKEQTDRIDKFLSAITVP